MALTVSSKAAILMEVDSGRALFSKNEHQSRLIASITKIMTAVIALEANCLEAKVVVDECILKAYGSNVYLEVGEEILFKDLLYGLMLRSGNDAALMIANYICGDETAFVKKMNERAQTIGMKNTVFVNVHGLDEDGGNYSTAYDMALLTRYAMQFETYQEIVGTKVKKVITNYKIYVWQNKNKLLDFYRWTTGGKTGFTEKAGRTLVSTATKGDLKLIVVTLNDGNDWRTHQDLYNYGFHHYHHYLILDTSTFTLDSAYYPGKLYIKNNVYYPLQAAEIDNITLKAKIYKPLPHQSNLNIGEIQVYNKNQIVHTEELWWEPKKVREKKKSFWWRLLRWFQHD